MFRILLICVFFLLVGCHEQGEEVMLKESNAWKVLEGKSVYFGHQSVGSNIMDGVRDISTGIHIKDFYIGTNRDPLSKIFSFREQITNAVESGEKIDIAMMKFCYVDFPSNVEMDHLLDTYISTMDSLQEKYPNIKFVHMTVPLTSENLSITVWTKRAIKSMLGKQTYDKFANEQRTMYNIQLRNLFDDTKLFDLAKIESNNTYKEYDSPALLPAYTEDGGHLNDVGRQEVAWEYLTFLSDLFS